MFAILLVSMAFNIVLIGSIYFILAHDTTMESDLVIMQLQARINELEFELSNVHTDAYLDEIIAEWNTLFTSTGSMSATRSTSTTSEHTELAQRLRTASTTIYYLKFNAWPL